MAFVIADRVRETTISTGTGSVTLAGAYTSFQTFATAIGNGNNTYYTIASATSGEWEVGIGTYATTGNLLSRDTVLASSTGGAKISFSGGSKDVFVTQPAERSLLLNSGSTGLFAGNAAFTANGIPYANSTTTLTTGSALTFDGTKWTQTASTTGILSEFVNSSSANQNGNIVATNDGGTRVRLQVFGSAAGSYGMLSANSPALYTSASELNFVADNASGVIKFGLNGSSEQMRLTSTGLGIGITSPYTKFDVTSGSLAAPTLGSPTAYAAAFRNGVGGGGYGLGVSVQSSGNAWLQAQRFDGTATAYDMVLQPLGGNVGIGASSPGEKLTVAATANNAGRFTSTATTTALVLDNTNANGWGSNIAINTGGVAAGYFGTIGSLLGSTAQDLAVYATSGNGFRVYTNGNNLRATFDSSGNLGLGVTPNTWSVGRALELGFAGNALWGNSADEVIVSQNAYYNSGWKYASSRKATHYSQYDAQHRWFTAPSGTVGNAISWTQAMTLDASGNLGVGQTNPSAWLVNGIGIGSGASDWGATIYTGTASSGYLCFADGASSTDRYRGYLQYNHANDAMVFATAATERARIDSSGNLLVGTQSFSFSSNGSQIGADGRIWNTSNVDYNFELAGSTGNRIRFYTSDGGNGATVGSITVSTTATAYNTSSDYRLKHDIAPMTGALAKVAALKPCTYKWKVDGSAGEGFIAHELAEVVPQAVTGSKDAVNEDGSIKPQGIDTSFLVATLTAAIQELKAEFDAYKATHP